MTINSHTDTFTVLRGLLPDDGSGGYVAPEPHFDAWDDTPHAYFIPGIWAVRIGDVVFATHQVDGIGQAEQRGAAARRLDLTYVVGASTQPTARAIIPLDQQILIKRYLPTPGHKWAYTFLSGEGGANPKLDAQLTPDYGSQTHFCCGGVDAGDGTNEHGYEHSQTICDECVDSWRADYTVVRHQA